jgi:hypothetical protein
MEPIHRKLFLLLSKNLGILKLLTCLRAYFSLLGLVDYGYQPKPDLQLYLQFSVILLPSWSQGLTVHD